MKLRSLLTAAIFLGMFAVSNPAKAAIFYNLDRTIGAGGVTGSITTDGTIGALAPANITDWNLIIDDGVGTFNLLGPLSGPNSAIQTTGLSASSTDLLINFGVSSNDFVIQNPSISSQSDLNYYAILSGSEIVKIDANQLIQLHPQVFLLTSIATAAPSAVPLPAAAWMFLTALGGLGLAGWRRRRATA